MKADVAIIQTVCSPEIEISLADNVKIFDRIPRSKVWKVVVNGYTYYLNHSRYECTSVSTRSMKYLIKVMAGMLHVAGFLNIYIDAGMVEWQRKLRTSFKLGKGILNTVMYADNEIIVAETECEL
jgi:hypothetical protein